MRIGVLGEPTFRKHAFTLILVYLVMAVGIVFSGYIYYLNYERNFRANAERQLSSIAESKISELVLWRKERFGDGAVLFRNTTISALVRRFLEKPDDSDAKIQLQEWLGKYHAAYHYEGVTLYDTQGIRRMSMPQPSKHVDLSVAHNVAAILRKGQVELQDFHRDSPDLPIHLSIVIPIFDERDDRRPLGVISLDIHPEVYLYPFINRWPTPSQTAETLLVRRDGDSVLFLNELKFQKNTALSLRIPLAKTELPSVKAALGQEGVVEGLDYRGNPVIAAVGAVPDSPWHLVARMNTAEVYAPLRERLWLMLTLVGVLLVGSAMSMGLIWKQRSALFFKEQYEAAEALKRAEEKFHLYIDNISDAIWVLGADLKVKYVSPSVKSIIGYTPEELLNTPSLDVIHPDDLPMILDAQARVLEHPGQPVTAQYRVIHKNGEHVYVETTGIGMMDNPSVQGLIIVMRDISKRKRAEEDFQRFFNLVPDMVCVASTDGSFLKVNPRWEETLGYTEYEMLSIPFYDLVHPDDREATLKELERQVAGQPTIMFTNRYLCRNGEYKWLEWMAAPSADKKLLFAAARDITGRKRAEERLREAKEKAEAATRLKDKFVEMVAHDLRSPLGSMIGIVKLFTERVSHLVREEDKKIIHLVFNSGDRMLRMIEELLKISRLQTGKVTPHPRFFKGHMAVAAMIQSLGFTAAQKGIEIVNEVPPDLRLYADPSLFDEVLLNLLSNSIKFCSRGDRITVFTPPELKSAIAVRDTGKGIDEKCMSNLFRHEVATSTPGTAGEIGTGLGLPFCYDIMKAHGGDLTVESIPGNGSLFCATLPYVKPVALLVEDDPLALMTMGAYLEKYGIDVIETMNGEQALAALKEKHPHIVITDIMMAEMDGLELLDRIKHDDEKHDIPVIVMTGGDSEARDNALRRGADDFVGKPVALEELIPRVRRFVG